MKKGWQKTARLGDLFMTAAGGTPLTTKREYYEGGTIPWLNSGEVRQGVVHSARAFITELGLRNSNAKIFPKDTVLVALYGATAAQVGILSIEAATNQAVFGIYPNSSFLPKFIFYFLLSCHQELSDQAVGSAQPNLSGLKVKDLQVPLAPLSEQQRIVGILDEAFGGLATAQAHAAQNLQNARDLFESHLNAVFTQRGDGWVETHKPLSELCDLIVDCEHKTAPTQDTGIPSIRTPNIGKGRLLLDGVNRVSEETYKAWTRRAEPQAGDLILAREAPAGNVAVIPENTRVCLGQRTVLIRPKDTVFDPVFLAFLILEPKTQSKLLAHSRGATVQHVNMKDIRALNLGAIPPLEMQRTIVSRLWELDTETQRLTQIYEQKLAALAELKKSLLHQAFSGEL